MNKLQMNNQTIDSREVAEMLEKEHKYVLRDIEGTNSVVGIVPTLLSASLHPAEYFIESSYTDRSGKSNKCFLVTKMGCEMLGNKQQGEKGILFTAKYVKRFNELESAVESNMYRLPSSYKEALQQLLIEVEENEILENKIKADKPKVLFAEAVENSDDVILVKEMALILSQHGFKIGQNQLYEYLRKHEYLCKKAGDMRNLPTKKYEHFFKVSKNIIQGTSGLHVANTPKITGSGQMYFIKKFAEYKERGLKIENLL